MAVRLSKIPATRQKYASTVTESGKWSGNVVLDEVALYEPLSRKKPTMYFVNSMSDLFHENVPFEWINKIMAVIAMCPQHTFQVLTKRSERMREYFQSFKERAFTKDGFTKKIVLSNNGAYSTLHLLYVEHIQKTLPNLWLGVSIEDQATANDRIPYLLETPAAIRFLSCEPLLGSIDFREIYASPYYPAIHWVIAGGESGHGSRPMHPDWVRSIKDQCLAAGVPFFFKQWGDYAKFYEKVGKSKSGCLLDGKEYKQFPNTIK
jgi:protein gp37